MNTYLNVVDAIFNNGYWGPHNVDYPFSLIALDRLRTDKNYVATRALTITCVEDIANAIAAGYLKEA